MYNSKTVPLLLLINLFVLAIVTFINTRAKLANAQCVTIPSAIRAETNVYTRESEHHSETGLVMRPISSHMCFLTYVRINDADSGGEWPGCEIYISSDGRWYLRARHAGGDDDDAVCSARCIQYH